MLLPDFFCFLRGQLLWKYVVSFIALFSENKQQMKFTKSIFLAYKQLQIHNLHDLVAPMIPWVSYEIYFEFLTLENNWTAWIVSAVV